MAPDQPASPVSPAARTVRTAFEAWLREQASKGPLRRASSRSVYAAMWGALADWCDRQQPPIRRLQALDRLALSAYLASRDPASRNGEALTPRYQWRLISLVRRVQDHARSADAGRPTASEATAVAALLADRPAVRLANAADARPLPGHLSAPQSHQLQRWLVGEADTDGPPVDAEGWQRLRDRCAVALQLGAGLGPGELRALRLTDVQMLPSPAQWLAGDADELPDHVPLRPHPPWVHGAAEPPGPHKAPADPARAHDGARSTALARQTPPAALPWALGVPASGDAAAHLAPLSGWAARLLADWLALRQAMALPGPWLFPSTRRGKPWGKVAQYNAALRLLADAGLPAPAGGPTGGSFRLRHSFALRQLRLGHSPERVARWLGIADPAVMARYRQAMCWPVPPDDGNADPAASGGARAAVPDDSVAQP